MSTRGIARKRSHSHLHNHIARSQALAHLAQQYDIDMCTVPEGPVKYPRSSIEEKDMGGTAEMLFNNNLEESYTVASGTTASTSSDLDSESSLDEMCPGEDLPANDSYTPEQQLHAMLGGDFHDERSQVAEDTNERQEEEGEGGSNIMSYNENDAGDTIEIDAQEQAMLDLLQFCQDAGTSLQFFDNLVTLLCRHGKRKASISGKPLDGRLFLTTSKKRYLALVPPSFKWALTRFQSLTY